MMRPVGPISSPSVRPLETWRCANIGVDFRTETVRSPVRYVSIQNVTGRSQEPRFQPRTRSRLPAELNFDLVEV